MVFGDGAFRDTASNARVEQSGDPLPASVDFALRSLHARDKRVVDLESDHGPIVVPLALVVYLCGHGPYDMPRIWQCMASGRGMSLRIRAQEEGDMLTWAISKPRFDISRDDDD
jgi:hypothetical protein